MQPAKFQRKISVEVRHDDAVQEFIILIHEGIKNWEAAGVFLAELRKKTPGIYAEIIKSEPLLTADMLATIERIGRKELHPQLLLDASMPLKRLIGYPYDEQVRLCREPIDVVAMVQHGQPRVVKKMVRDLSRVEMQIALGPTSVRTVKDQIACHTPIHGGNDEWKKLSGLGKPLAPLPAPKAPKPASPSQIIPPSPPPESLNLICIGRWVVRQSIGNNCGFERTTASPPDKIRVLLDSDGLAVIEVCKRK